MSLKRIIGSIGLCSVAALVGATMAAQGATAAGQQEKHGEKLAHNSDCFSCHAVDHKVVGPAFAAVARRYAGQSGVVPKLVEKVQKGGAGNWGDIPMSPHPDLSKEQITQMVDWILSLKGGVSHAGAPTQTYTYTLADGKTAEVDFPVFVKGHGQEVTKDVFRGWELFNSYCYRCHGEDAVGGEYAPDLRQSLKGGMSKEQFLTTALVGRPDKGMPKWAGFFDSKEISQIYDYTKARSLGLVPVGRPKSASD